jgi:Peptidase family S41
VHDTLLVPMDNGGLRPMKDPRRPSLAWVLIVLLASCATPTARAPATSTAPTSQASVRPPARRREHQKLIYLQDLKKALAWVGDNLEDASALAPTKSFDDMIRRLSSTYPEAVEATHLPDGGWRLDDRRGTTYSIKAPPNFGELAWATGNTISFYYDALADVPIEGFRAPERFALAGLLCNLDRDSTLLTPLDMRTLMPPDAPNWEKWARAAEFDRGLPALARCDRKPERPVPVSPPLGADQLVDGTLYVPVRSLSAGYGRGLQRELQQAAAQGPLRGVILDLRGSTGGLYAEAMAMADVFLPAGGALVMYSRRGNKSKLDSTKDDASDSAAPLILLIDGATAAGSEMFAAIMQERGRALLVGSRTLGRGTVQVVFDLSYELGAVKLTTARIRTAGGREIEGVGVGPDVWFGYLAPGASEAPPPDAGAEITLPLTSDPLAAIRLAHQILATARRGDRKALLDAARALSGRFTHEARTGRVGHFGRGIAPSSRNMGRGSGRSPS